MSNALKAISFLQTIPKKSVQPYNFARNAIVLDVCNAKKAILCLKINSFASLQMIMVT
jgi:hypothetical protein